MFGIDGAKLIVIAVVALVVIGPRDLPRTLAQLGKTVGNLRRVATQFRSQFDEMIKDSELDEVRKVLGAVHESIRGADASRTRNEAPAKGSTTKPIESPAQS